MRVFITGATGYLGSDVVRELTEAGHEVWGLTRSAGKASLLSRWGARPVVGDVLEPGSYRAEAEAADALVHLAADGVGARAAADRAAVETLLGAAAAGRAHVFAYTSGCFVLGDTGDDPAHEDASTTGAPEYVAWRPPHEQWVLNAGNAELATAVIRPGMVYGGSEGAFADLFESASRDGVARFVGGGENRWSPVYRGDVSRLYRQVVEGSGRGVFHCAEPPARVRTLAEAASRAAGAGGEVEARSVEEARQELGGFADAAAMDQVMGCDRARAFGWAPEHPPFLESADAVYLEWADVSRSSSDS